MRNTNHHPAEPLPGASATTLVDALIYFAATLALAGAIVFLARVFISLPTVSPIVVLCVIISIVALRKRLAPPQEVVTESRSDEANAIVESIEREASAISKLLRNDATLETSAERFRPLLQIICTRAQAEYSQVKCIDDRISELAKVGAVHELPELKAERAQRFESVLDAYVALQNTRREILQLAEHSSKSRDALAGETNLSLEDAIAALNEECRIAERVSQRLDGETPPEAHSHRESEQDSIPTATTIGNSTF